MNAILTKWISATDHNGARIKAYDNMGRNITCSIFSDDDEKDQHERAVKLLCEKFAWPVASIVGGRTKEGWAFVVDIDYSRKIIAVPKYKGLDVGEWHRLYRIDPEHPLVGLCVIEPGFSMEWCTFERIEPIDTPTDSHTATTTQRSD